MKKLLVLILSVLLIFGFVACGSNNNNDPAEAEYNNGNGTEVEQPTDSGSAVADFLAEYGDELREELEMLSLEDTRIEILAGTGNEIIFVFHFDDVEDADVLEVAFDMTIPVFQMLTDMFQEELEVDSMRVTVRYFDAGGNLVIDESFDS